MNEDLNDLTRDAYAHFGLAYFLAECAFQGLVQVVATHGVGLSRGDVEERVAYWSTQTLGPVVNEAKKASPSASFAESLDRLVARRNYLAHGFWYESAHKMTTASGLDRLIAELIEDQALFRAISEETDAIAIAHLERAGLSADFDADTLAKARSEAPEPPCGRRRLKRGQTLSIIAAWRTPTGHLLFEDDLRELWQASPYGLGWYVGTLQTDWDRALSGYFPADVIARPKDVREWNYSLRFSTGIVIEARLSQGATDRRLKLRRSSANE